MYKFLLVFPTMFLLSGCANFAINGMMCDRIVADPFSTIPTECRNYVDSEATKASRAPSEVLAPDDLLIFEKKK